MPYQRLAEWADHRRLPRHRPCWPPASPPHQGLRSVRSPHPARPCRSHVSPRHRPQAHCGSPSARAPDRPAGSPDHRPCGKAAHPDPSSRHVPRSIASGRGNHARRCGRLAPEAADRGLSALFREAGGRLEEVMRLRVGLTLLEAHVDACEGECGARDKCNHFQYPLSIMCPNARGRCYGAKGPSTTLGNDNIHYFASTLFRQLRPYAIRPTRKSPGKRFVRINYTPERYPIILAHVDQMPLDGHRAASVRSVFRRKSLPNDANLQVLTRWCGTQFPSKHFLAGNQH